VMAVAKKHACGFCKRGFSSTRILSSHMCVKKQRNANQSNIASQHGLRLFQKFMQINTPTKTPKTFNDFIDSKYYTTFIKFARHLMDLRPVNRDRFVDFVFRTGIPDRDWCKDKTYEAYIIDLITKEPADAGLTRSIETMIKWGEENNLSYNEFFAKVAPAEGMHLVRMGKISPWVLYLATGVSLFDRLSPEQAGIIVNIFDPDIWRAKFEIKKRECDEVRESLEDAGI